MKALLECEGGANLAVADVKHGWTAAHSAVIAGNAVGARMLRRAGAAFETRDKSGASVFDLLRENGIRLDEEERA